MFATTLDLLQLSVNINKLQAFARRFHSNPFLLLDLLLARAHSDKEHIAVRI